MAQDNLITGIKSIETVFNTTIQGRAETMLKCVTNLEYVTFKINYVPEGLVRTPKVFVMILKDDLKQWRPLKASESKVLITKIESYNYVTFNKEKVLEAIGKWIEMIEGLTIKEIKVTGLRLENYEQGDSETVILTEATFLKWGKPENMVYKIEVYVTTLNDGDVYVRFFPATISENQPTGRAMDAKEAKMLHEQLEKFVFPADIDKQRLLGDVAQYITQETEIEGDNDVAR